MTSRRCRSDFLFCMCDYFGFTQARGLQIEGFVGDVVRRCGIEPLCEAAMEAVVAKLEKS